MDALEYLLIFWEGCIRYDFQLRQVDSFAPEMPSALVVDAKALYDSLKAETPSLQGDKRTKIEAMVTKQKMVGMRSRLKWVSSEAQIADGVTKFTARQLFADRLRSHCLSLQSDMTFQAAKKKTQAERQANSRRHAISRTGNTKQLAFAVLTSQMIGVKAMAAEEALAFMLSPEMTLTLYVILFGMFIWQCLKVSTSMSFSVTRLTWLRTTTSSSSQVGTQTDHMIEETIRLIKAENIRLRNFTNDQEAEIFELQAQCTAHEEDLNEMVEKVEFLKGQLTEAEQDLHKTSFQWANLQQRFVNLKNELESDFIPRVIWTTKRGKSFHTTMECQGLATADRDQLKTWEARAFCATEALVKWRRL